MKTPNLLLLFICSFYALSSCTEVNSKKMDVIKKTDPLASWKQGETKNAIISFVTEVTNAKSSNFVPVSDRVAVFDNDGTLWSEQPIYFQLFYALDKVKEQAKDHPEWEDEQPFKAVLNDDMDGLKKQGIEGLLKILMETHTGNTSEEFEKSVTDWLSKAEHPGFNRPYTDLVYQPMLELLNYLKTNDFKVFIVSGGGIEFMRPWVEKVYGVPKERVIGSTVETEFLIEDGKPMIKRLPKIEFIDDKEGKPVAINKHIGRKPIFCAGNSDGDLAMMEYTASGNGKKLMLYVHHTDSIREWAYDRNSPIGRLDKGLDVADSKGWTVMDMKNDWELIYPFELKDPK